MAVSIVSDPESEQELVMAPSDAQERLPLFQYVILFRISLQIHSFSKDRGKRNKTGNPSISNMTGNPSTILMSDILTLADSSHLPSDEAYRQCLSIPYYRLSTRTPCYECIWILATYDVVFMP